MNKLLCILLASSLLNACTWVDLNEEGYSVNLVEVDETIQCTKVGTTSSKVLDNIWLLPRNKKKVSKELVRLAKNQAGAMGGNTITAQSEAWNGTQEFNVYNC